MMKIIPHSWGTVRGGSSQEMELENIILSEVIQAQKTENPMFSLICRL
jgi:hypothetical protein